MSRKSFTPEIKIAATEEEILSILAKLVIQQLEKHGLIESLQAEEVES